MPAIAVRVMAKKRSASRLRIERTSRPRSLVAEPVPHAADREDQLGLLGVGFDLLAEVADVDVDRARVAVVRAAPYALQQHLPGEDPTRAARERVEDLELD